MSLSGGYMRGAKAAAMEVVCPAVVLSGGFSSFLLVVCGCFLFVFFQITMCSFPLLSSPAFPATCYTTLLLLPATACTSTFFLYML